MKVCIIGACGHTEQAVEIISKRTDIYVCGIAPGSSHENLKCRFEFSYPVPYYKNYISMLDKTKPDLAIVSPVFGLTSQIIVECAKRGIDVFSEKPVATTLCDLKKVEKAVKESGIRFCAMHYLRFSPAFYEGARLVSDGAIGVLKMITAQKSYKFGTRPEWYYDRTLYGGTIPWVGIHAIDWIYHFSGKNFLSVNAHSIGTSPEMAALCQFRLEDGVIASINLDYYRPDKAPTHDDDRIRCVGTKGVLEIRDGSIYITNEQASKTIKPAKAPELFTEFINGNTPISPNEIFYLTRVALLARNSADTEEEIRIEV